MITITRRLAKRLRTVFRQALNLPTYGALPPIRLSGGAQGLVVRCLASDAAVEFHLPGEQPDEQIWIPPQLLGDVQGTGDAPVEIQSGPHGSTASWHDGSVPQMVQHPVVEPWNSDFPGAPERLAENPPGLLQAMHDACRTTDPEATHYALGCVQLRGASGTIAASDGRQLLVQSGFSFPWDESLLLPACPVFGCRELLDDEPVRIGKLQEWIIVCVGGWTVWQKLNVDGRFPEVDHHLPAAAAETARLCITPADRQFLLKNLPRLNSVDECNLPLTVDLNGQVALRARVANQPLPTELRLTGSSYTGQPMRLSTNRRYLARAIELGFREIRFVHARAPALARDDRRLYLWALLDPESAIRPAAEAIRVDSPGRSTRQPSRRRQTNMTRSKATCVPAAESKPQTDHSTPEPAGSGQPLSTFEQATALRDVLRQAAATAGDLVRALQRDRKQAKALRSTLASLRQIETLEV